MQKDLGYNTEAEDENQTERDIPIFCQHHKMKGQFAFKNYGSEMLKTKVSKKKKPENEQASPINKPTFKAIYLE